jgi:hypothetical protein
MEGNSMVEAGIKSTSIRLPGHDLVNLAMFRIGFVEEEYAQVWIDREATGGRIRVQGETLEGEEVSILPAAYRKPIDFRQLMRGRTLLPITPLSAADRDTGVPWVVIHNVKLRLDGLVTMAWLPESLDNVARREWWSAARLYAEMIGGEPKLTPEMGPKILPAQLEVTRKIRAGQITPWDMSKPDEPKRVPIDRFRRSRFWGTTIVSVYGELISWPTPKNEDDHSCRIMFYADEGKRVSPRLDWLREEAERHAVVARAWLTKLNGLIALNETNGPDWKVERVAAIGGNLENLTAEEAAAVRLVNGFSSVQANAELLYEAKKIRHQIGDRFVEAVRAGRLEITGRDASDLKVRATIPASLITPDRIWELLRSDELEIAHQRYVDARIGPLESLEAAPEPRRGETPEEHAEHKAAPGRKPGVSPKQREMCDAAKKLLDDDHLRPKQGHGWRIAIARILKKRKEFETYKAETIAGYIGGTIDEWELQNQDK